MIYRNSLKPWHSFAVGLADIFDGLVAVLSLGFYGSGMGLKVCIWAKKRELMAERTEKGGGA